MKQIGFLMLVLFLVGNPIIAQDSPKKMMKKADRSLSKYNLDQQNNKEELMEAKELIDQAVKDEEIGKEGRAWVVKGQTYSALANEDLKMAMANPKAKPSYPESPYISYEAFMEALNVADKSRYEREALEGLGNLTPVLSTVGNSYLQSQEYAKAYEPLNALLEIHNTFVEEDENPIYQNEADYDQQRFIVAICATQAGDTPNAKRLLTELYEEEYQDAAVYSTLFELLMKEDNEEKALKVLEKGKEMFPKDNTILFARINYYIQNDELELLEESLKEAIKAEPENASVHSALANVYMKIYNQLKEEENYDEEEAMKYRESAIKYYNNAIDLDSSDFEPYYSVGSIYFNDAAVITQKMSELGMSKEDQKMYDSLKVESEKLFAKALPYFKNAEKLEPNDINSLLALREIFARTNEFEKAQELKVRMEKIQNGEQFKTPYFDEQ
jgi:tetratricopeptide (TPR) repeat protein